MCTERSKPGCWADASTQDTCAVALDMNEFKRALDLALALDARSRGLSPNKNYSDLPDLENKESTAWSWRHGWTAETSESRRHDGSQVAAREDQDALLDPDLAPRLSAHGFKSVKTFNVSHMCSSGTRQIENKCCPGVGSAGNRQSGMEKFVMGVAHDVKFRTTVTIKDAFGAVSSKHAALTPNMCISQGDSRMTSRADNLRPGSVPTETRRPAYSELSSQLKKTFATIGGSYNVHK